MCNGRDSGGNWNGDCGDLQDRDRCDERRCLHIVHGEKWVGFEVINVRLRNEELI